MPKFSRPRAAVTGLQKRIWKEAISNSVRVGDVVVGVGQIADVSSVGELVTLTNIFEVGYSFNYNDVVRVFTEEL